eukprot:1144777_1
MASIEAKKAEICALWGLPLADIDNKISTLKCIITDSSEPLLLDYLLRADLNIERAIDLHFGHTPTPPPPQPIHNDNTHSHNHNASNQNHNDDPDELDLDRLFTFEDDEPNNPPPKESSEDIEILPNNVDRDSTSTTNTESNDDEPFAGFFQFRIHDSDHEDNNKKKEDAPLVPIPNPNNRKRKYNSYDFGGDGLLQPMVKKRRLNSDHDQQSDSEPQNSNNSRLNHNNSSNHNGNNNAQHEPMDTDAENELPDVEHDPNWTKKVFGTLRIEYTETHFCGEFSNLYEFALAKRNRKLSIDRVGPHASQPDEDKLLELYDLCLEEQQYVTSKQMIGTVSTLKHRTLMSEETEEDKKYEEALQRELDHIQSVASFSLWDDPFVKRQITELAKSRITLERNPQKFCVEFEIAFKRKRMGYQSNLLLLRNRKEPTSFTTESPYIVALLGGSKALAEEIMNYKRLIEEYSEKKHIYSMVSLLDFACRFDYDVGDTNANYPHELNIELHQYQLQSLRWMMNEENDEIGFYRHLFKKGRFADRSTFYYSALFDEIVINDSLPVVHGGFLCEEMGLGKTIISMALIRCAAPSDLSTYSTASVLRVAHSYTERRYSWDYSDPTAPARVPIDVEFKYYKSKATLIIAPVSLVGQWEKEVDEKCVRKLKCKRYYGQRKRDVRVYIDEDIIFTTYGILGKEGGEDREKHILHQIEWHRVILDESHYIKNGACSAAKSINKLRAVNKWCLSGTPFGRQIYDIHNQLQFIGMKSEHLSKVDLKTISKRKLFNGSNSMFGRSICRPLLGVIQKLVMRHKKAQKFNNEAIVEMPDKEEDVLMVDFTAKQREYYMKLYNTAKERYDYYKTINNIGRGSISILASLHPARQACSGYIYSKDNIEQELSNAQARTFHIRNMVNSNSNLNLSRQQLYEMAEDEAFNDRDGECPICYECPFDEPLQTPCRHVFCGECIRAILQDKQLCPMCRKPVYPQQLKKPKEEEKKKKEEEEEKPKEEKKEKPKEEDEGDQIRFDSKLKV